MQGRLGPRLGMAALALLLIVFAWFSAVRAIDFPLYYHAASKLLQGQDDLYPPFLTGGGGPVLGHGFRYAPALALLFVPLALLPMQAAAFLFFWLKVPAFVYLWRVVARRMALERPYSRLILLSLLVTGGYLAEEFRNGNLHFLVIVLMVMALDLADRGRVAAPAAALGVAIAAKLLPAVLLAYLVLRRRFAAAAATVAVVGVLAIAPAAVVGWDANVRLTRTFLRYAAMKIDEQANHALRGTLYRYLQHNGADDPRNPDWNVADLPDRTVSAIWLALTAAGAATLAAALWRAPVNEEGRLLEWSLLLTAMLIGAPHAQRIHFSTLLFPVAVVLAVVRTHPDGRGIPLARAALWTLGIVGTLMPLLLSTRRWAVAFEALSPQFLAALFFGLALLVLTVLFKKPPGTPARDPA